MEHKEIYYYNPKYPEYGIETLPLEYIEWITTSTSKNAEKRLYAVASKLDIETGTTLSYPKSYHIYSPYPEEEDGDMFVLDLLGNRERILSFNHDKIVLWWETDLRIERNHLKERLEDIEECLNQK